MPWEGPSSHMADRSDPPADSQAQLCRGGRWSLAV
jgi:hypothetical protein